MRPVGLDQRELQGGLMVVEGTLTHPCPGFAVGKLAMVVVRVQGALQHLLYIPQAADVLSLTGLGMPWSGSVRFRGSFRRTLNRTVGPVRRFLRTRT